MPNVQRHLDNGESGNANGKAANEVQQNLLTQIHALRAAGCERTYEDIASGGRWDRPELHKALNQLQEGDVIVVVRLARLSRSLKGTLTILERIEKAKSGFQSLNENIDTTTPAGRAVLAMLATFAAFERDMIRERTRAALETARGKRHIGGRRPKLDPEQIAEILEMVNTQEDNCTGGEVQGAPGDNLPTIGPGTDKQPERALAASERMIRPVIA